MGIRNLYNGFFGRRLKKMDLSHIENHLYHASYGGLIRRINDGNAGMFPRRKIQMVDGTHCFHNIA